MGIRISGRKNKEPEKVLETQVIEGIEEVNISNSFNNVLGDIVGEPIENVEEKRPIVKPSSMGTIFEGAVDDIRNKDVDPEEIESQTDKIIKKVHQEAVIQTIKNGEDIQKKILNSAKEDVETTLEIKKSTNQLKAVKASYNANKDACENLGLDDEGRPMWQIRVAKIINDFWFIVWALISAVTLTPIIFILKRVGTQVKSAKLTWILTFLFYLLIMFLLFLIIVTVWNSAGTPPEWIQKLLGGKKNG